MWAILILGAVALCSHPVGHMGGVRGGDGATLGHQQTTVDSLEEPCTAAHEDRRKMDTQLIDEAGGERLGDDVGTTHDHCLLVPCFVSGRIHGCEDAAGDEDEALGVARVLGPDDDTGQRAHLRANFVRRANHGSIPLRRLVCRPPAKLPFVGRSDRRGRVIERCRSYTATTERQEGVVTATVYETQVIPPLPGIPRYDILMLIRARTPERLAEIRADLQELEPDFVMTAQNTRRIGDTGRNPAETFLFNHFTAAVPEVALEGFDQVAGWFPDKLGVDNATLLQPVDQATSPYVFVNYVRVPNGARRFLLAMLTRPSFHTHVRRILRERDMTALPLLATPV